MRSLPQHAVLCKASALGRFVVIVIACPCRCFPPVSWLVKARGGYTAWKKIRPGEWRKCHDQHETPKDPMRSRERRNLCCPRTYRESRSMQDAMVPSRRGWCVWGVGWGIGDHGGSMAPAVGWKLVEHVKHSRSERGRREEKVHQAGPSKGGRRTSVNRAKFRESQAQRRLPRHAMRLR